MSKRHLITILLLIIALALLSAPVVSAQSSAMRTYTVIANSENQVSAQLLNEIRAAGGVIRRSEAALGLVFVSSANPRFASAVPSARAVVRTLKMKLIEPERVQLLAAADVANPPTSGDDDPLFDIQWGADAVDAPEAWNAGRRGAGVRVAILDEGVDADHPDLADRVNPALSRSFVPGEDWNPPPGFYFNHGTHVAGIVAASDNAFGTIGVAPQAEIVAIHVLSRDLGFGLDEWIISGIKYAADIGADIINMSLGSGPLDLRGGCVDPNDPESCYTRRDVIEWLVAYTRAANYARRHGTTVIASAGNDSFDFRANRHWIHLPSDAPGIISVSALGPLNWATNPGTDLDVPASYTNIGPRIAFSAPGGNFDYPGNENCTLIGITRPCWVFDMVIAPIPGGWSWAAGTSMAAPHVAGVAATYIGANGGSMHPVLVELALRRLADDRGPRGRDDVFGWGRVDAAVAD